jgi:hypothetical protein
MTNLSPLSARSDIQSRLPKEIYHGTNDPEDSTRERESTDKENWDECQSPKEEKKEGKAEEASNTQHSQTCQVISKC